MAFFSKNIDFLKKRRFFTHYLGFKALIFHLFGGLIKTPILFSIINVRGMKRFGTGAVFLIFRQKVPFLSFD